MGELIRNNIKINLKTCEHNKCVQVGLFFYGGM